MSRTSRRATFSRKSHITLVKCDGPLNEHVKNMQKRPIMTVHEASLNAISLTFEIVVFSFNAHYMASVDKWATFFGSSCDALRDAVSDGVA